MNETPCEVGIVRDGLWEPLVELPQGEAEAVVMRGWYEVVVSHSVAIMRRVRVDGPFAFRPLTSPDGTAPDVYWRWL